MNEDEAVETALKHEVLPVAAIPVVIDDDPAWFSWWKANVPPLWRALLN